jgi:hypothetical protein
MRVLVIGSAVLVFACSSAGDSGGGGAGGTTPSENAVPAGPALPRVTDRDSANASLGKQVRVDGAALNAKLGPVVSTGGLVIYCFGKQEWSADQVGQQVVVTGTLEQTDEFKAEVGPDGEQTAGTGGRDLVIRDCKVEGR